MRTLAALLIAGCCAAASAAEPGATPCTRDPNATGMQARIDSMHHQVMRAQAATDPAEQRRCMTLHAKLVGEGLRELRRREPELQPACRMELMQSLMEQMVAHQAASHELEDR
jgi:fumarylacetoacetate (FAA) hydrolase family protein